jgi:hypothetical protein
MICPSPYPFPEGRELQEESMTYPLERYLNGRSAMDGSFRPDGRRPAFLTDITGTYQVWAVDVPPPGHRTS